MPVGLLSVNDNNYVQIDQDYRNLFFEAKETVNIASSENGYNYPVSMDVMVAATCCVVPYYYSSSVFYSVLLSDHATDTVYKFNRKQTTASNFGLAVYNAAAQLVFDAGWKPLRVVDIVSASSNQIFTNEMDTSLDVITKSYPAGRTYAVVTLTPMLTNVVQNNDTGQGGVVVVTKDWYAYTFTISGGSITFKWARYATRTQPDAEPEGRFDYLNNPYKTALFLVVDVTNF